MRRSAGGRGQMRLGSGQRLSRAPIFGASAGQLMLVTPPRRAVPEARIPDERHHRSAAIHQVDRQGFAGHPRGSSASFLYFNDLSGWSAQSATLHGPCPSRSRRKASLQAAHSAGKSICAMSQSLVFLERGQIHTGDVTLDGLCVLDDVFQGTPQLRINHDGLIDIQCRIAQLKHSRKVIAGQSRICRRSLCPPGPW